MWGGGEEKEGEIKRIFLTTNSMLTMHVFYSHLVSGADMPAIFNLYHPEE